MRTDWHRPSELPDLRRVGLVAFDTETKDGGLFADRGSGWPWGDGYITGISVAYRIERAILAQYFPLHHPDSQNFDREQVQRWLKDHVASGLRFAGHGTVYDWGWLCADLGAPMPPSEQLEETGALATIINENRHSYKLDALCKWRGLLGKDENLLRESCAALGLITNKRKKFKPQPYIWQLPARFVGPYAEIDAVRTLELFESLDPVLDQENTRGAYRLEVDLLPMVLAMRRRGIRIDVDAAERIRDQLLQKRDAYLAELSEKLGTPVGMDELNRSAWRAKTFDQHHIAYPRTEKGNPSFTAGNTGWMTKHAHWLPQLIVKVDKYNNAAVNFLETYILGHINHGRVHAEIHPHRSDDDRGTRSLRFSYSSPPLQLMPAHDEELAPLIRGVFLPEENELWAKCDASQQEFRLVVHYAVRHKFSKAGDAARLYRNDPNTDFHGLVSQWTGIARQSAKNTNFARIYGAGVRKFAEMIGKSESEAREIWVKYDRELPFVSQLSIQCEDAARRTGYLTLYGGARRHFNLWAIGGKWQKAAGPCERDEALRRVNDPQHAWHRQQLWHADTRNALNALIQGSAAAHTKLWMRDVWREAGGRIVPALQMHDALELSVSSPEQAELVARLGCEAVKLEVPMKVDIGYGRNWADAKHTWAELHAETSLMPDDRERTPREVPKFFNDFDDEPDSLPADDIVITVLNEDSKHSTNERPPWEGEPTFAATPHTFEPTLGGDGFDGFTADRESAQRGKILCPFHEEKTPSCQLYTDGHYHCFGCGAHGWIDDDLDIDAATLATTTSTEDDTQTLERGLELWDEGKPITGTLAERYLTDIRKLDLALLTTDVNAVLRFHQRCPFGPNGTRHPCLLALFRDVESDAPAGIHRIGLTPDANKIKRLTLGRWPSPRAIKLLPITHKLTIGEGIETVLGALRCGAVTPPAWAMGPKADIANFPVLPGVKALTVLVDRGDPAALDGAEMCAARYVAAGIPARWLRTVRVKDFNDLVLP